MASFFGGSLRALVVAVLLGSAAVGSANAQTTVYSQAKLEAFVVAAIAVNSLIDKWVPRIQVAKSEAEAEQMRRQANAELIAAVEETEGISVDEYEKIGEAARSDPDLAARIEKIFVRKQRKE